MREDIQAKSGELSIIRVNLATLHDENIQLRQQIAINSIEAGEKLKQSRLELERQIKEQTIALQFKNQEMATLQRIKLKKKAVDTSLSQQCNLFSDIANIPSFPRNSKRESVALRNVATDTSSLRTRSSITEPKESSDVMYIFYLVCEVHTGSSAYSKWFRYECLIYHLFSSESCTDFF